MPSSAVKFTFCRLPSYVVTLSESGHEDNEEEGEEVNPAMNAGNYTCTSCVYACGGAGFLSLLSLLSWLVCYAHVFPCTCIMYNKHMYMYVNCTMNIV